MANILTDCASQTLGKLVDFTVAESRYICCFKCIVKDFEEEQKELQNSRDNVTFLQTKAENLIKVDTEEKMTCASGWCPNCIGRYRRGKELAKMTDEIRKLKEKHAPSLPGVEDRSLQGYIHFESRKARYEELRSALLNENYMTALHGMGGNGKTTMAIKVGQELQVSKQFDRVIFTTVSNAPSVRKMQNDIAAPFGLDLNNKSEPERQKLLWKALTDGRKVLIILDDVWEPIDLHEIGVPTSDNHGGCKVLITTRDLGVCNSMGCLSDNIVQLDLLQEEDAWTLFKEHAVMNDDTARNLQDKGKEIVKECQGLPVAIAAIACTLKDKTRKEEWNVALKDLQKPMHGVHESLKGTYKCLSYSYDNLNCQNAKDLFLLCSLFPEDTELDSETLTRLGTGVGIFGEVDKYDDARDRVLKARNKLVDSCLLLKAEKGRVKMHDLVREVALWIASQEIQLVMMPDKRHKPSVEKKNTKYLFCDDMKVQDMDLFPNWFDVTKLQILILLIASQESVEFPNAFFEKMTMLRVLNLETAKWAWKPLSLPKSILSLASIRSVMLNDWILGDISILGTLQTLETLDLVRCSISEIPNKIVQLKKLRLVTLVKCRIERNNPFEVLGSCSALEELYFKGNKIVLLDNLNNAKEVSQNFRALVRYHLDEEKIDSSSISKSVSLPDIEDLISEATFKSLVGGAEILRLERIKGDWGNLIPELLSVDAGMKDLVKLGLKSCSKFQCLIDTRHMHSRVRNVFSMSKLVTIELKELDNLKELCIGPFPSNMLKTLERLHIKQCAQLGSILFTSKLELCKLKIMTLVDCPMLASLFDMSTARSLVVLEELTIHKCDQLTELIADARPGDDNDQKSTCNPLFPKLNTLDVEGCHQLQYILPLVCLTGDSLLLKSIKISDWDELKHIFGQYKHEDQDWHQEAKDIVLGSFEEMIISGFPNLKTRSVKRPFSTHGSKREELHPNSDNFLLRSLSCCFSHGYRPKNRSATSTSVPERSQKLNLECQDALSGAQQLSKHSLVLNNIRKIELKKLSKIKSVFTLSTATTMLLESLEVTECHELKYIIVDTGNDCDNGNKWTAVFPKLKKLSLSKCDKMKYLFGLHSHDHQLCNEIHIHLPALESVTLWNLPNAISIYPESYRVSWPSLTEIRFEECPNFTVTFVTDSTVELNSGQLAQTKTEESQTSSSESVLPFYATQSLVRQSIVLHNIKDMSLIDCSKTIQLFTFSVAQTMFVETLVIKKCHGVKYIIDNMGDDKYRKNCSSVFPKLKILRVWDCDQLEYIFGEYNHENENQNLEFHIHLQALKVVDVGNLPSIINISHKSYCVTCPSLVIFRSLGCPQIESISHFIDSRQLDGTTTKILPHMTDICMGPKSLFSLQNLKELRIEGSEKAGVIFPTSILRWLPQLTTLMISDCKELKHVIEEDMESQKLTNSFSSQIWCPMLKFLFVEQCNKLKRLIRGSTSNVLRLPNLEFLHISECSEIEEIFGCEKGDGFEDVKCEFPKLNAMIFMQLPSFCQEILELQTVRHRFVHNCPKLSVTATATLRDVKNQFDRFETEFDDPEVDWISYRNKLWWFLKERTSDIPVDVEAQVASGSELPSSQVNTITNQSMQADQNDNGIVSDDLISVETKTKATPDKKSSPIVSPNLELKDEQSRGEPCLMAQQQPLRETQIPTEICPADNFLKETEDQSIQKLSKSEKNVTAAMSANLETRSTSLAPTQIIEGSIGGGTTSNNGTSSTHWEPACSLSGPLVTSYHKNYPNYSNEELEREFVAKVFSSEIHVTATSLTLSELCEMPSPSTLDNPCHQIHSHGLVNEQSRSGNQQQPLGDTQITIEIPHENTCLKEADDQSIQDVFESEKTETEALSTESETRNTSPGLQCIKRSVEAGNTSNDDMIVTSSTHMEQASSLSAPLVASYHKTYPNDDGDGQMHTPSISLVAAQHPATIHNNSVANVLSDLQVSLKMALKDIAISEENTLELLTTLSFLSHFSLADATLSDELKAVVDSLFQEFPSILCSFKKAKEKEKSIKEKLAQRNKAAINIVSKISYAQQKEAVLNEQILRLQNEIKDCENEKKRCAVETIGYEKEFESALQELFEIEYKWSVLCSKFEHNRIATTNHS